MKCKLEISIFCALILFLFGLTTFFFEFLFCGKFLEKDFIEKNVFSLAPELLLWILFNSLIIPFAVFLGVRSTFDVVENNRHFPGNIPQTSIQLGLSFIYSVVLLFVPVFLISGDTIIPILNDTQRFPIKNVELKLIFINVIGYSGAVLLLWNILNSSSLSEKAKNIKELSNLGDQIEKRLTELGLLLSLAVIATAAQLQGLDKLHNTNFANLTVPYGVSQSIFISLFYVPCYFYYSKRAQDILPFVLRKDDSIENSKSLLVALKADGNFVKALQAALPIVAALLSSLIQGN